MKPALSLLASLACSLTLARAQGAVHVVDDVAGPGVDFTSLQAAVDAAFDGDTLLVKAGTYGTADINGKSLVVAADAPSGAVKSGGMRIRNLTSGQQVVLRGLEMSIGSTAGTFAQLDIQSNTGVVWVEDCSVKGFFLPAANMLSSSAVVFLRCTLEGGTTAWNPFTGTPGFGTSGLAASFSNVHAYACVFRGGPGGYNPMSHTTGNGGAGGGIVAAFLFASEASFIGGPGGGGSFCQSSTGGYGLFLGTGGPTPVAQTLGCTFTGGAAHPSCTFGQTGLSVIVQAGTHVLISGTPCSLAAGSPIREGQSVGAQLAGEPGSIAVLVIGLAPGASFLPAFSGSLLLDAPFAVVGTMILPGSGATPLSLPFGSLPAGLESLSFYGQLGLLTPSLQIQACSGSALLVLDQQF